MDVPEMKTVELMWKSHLIMLLYIGKYLLHSCTVAGWCSWRHQDHTVYLF